jgi:hypothetical protein
MSTNETDIVKLSLNDTFYDWYLKTNQVIDYVNPVNVYDVFAGAGLSESRTGNPGTIELSVATNPSLYGINTLVSTQGVSQVVLDYNALSQGTVSNTSLFSIQNNTDQIFFVEASDMLPPEINGNHAFGGVITVADLIVDDGTITINNTGSNRDSCGLVIESVNDTNTENVSFTYDTTTEAWYSSEYLGVKSGKGFVTDSSPKAVFPFIATSAQGQVDVRLQSTIGGIPERISLEAEFDANNSLTVAHYLNNSLVNEIVEFTSNGTNGSSVIVKDTIQITDILNSNPFSQTPAVTSVPITDSTNGYLSQFVNRVKVAKGSAAVGDFVRMNGSSLAKASPSSVANAQVLGVVESIDGANAVVITSGPFSGISGLSGLTTGDVYYLDPNSAGDVTNTDPLNTNGVLDKPVFIATSATSGVIIPDFAGTGTTVVGGGGGSGTINNAFATISIGTTDITASGEDTLTLVGGDNITLVPSGNQITINCDITSSGTANTFLTYNNSGAFTQLAPSSYSVLAKPLNGALSSVVIQPGNIIGRLDDTDDTDNPVQSLSASQVLDILGFSSNSFIRTISFETGTGTTEYTFDADTTGEDVVIRAGSNISFEYAGGALYINSTGDGGTNTVIGSGELTVGTEGGTQYTTNTINFETDYAGSKLATEEFIQFSIRQVTSNIAFISAKPTENYFRYNIGASGANTHTPGYTLQLATDTKKNLVFGFSKNTTAKTENISINLSPTIQVDKIIPSVSTQGSGLILSGGDDAGRNTLRLIDEPRNIGSGDESTIVINAFDDITPPITRQSTQNLGGTIGSKCVSFYADSDAPTAGDPYTYPFRFYKIIVDEIECQNLVAQEATKVEQTVNRILGTADTTTGFGANVSRIIFTDDASGVTPFGATGTMLQFKDSITGSTAYIFKPSDALTTPDTTVSKMLIVGDGLRFANPSSVTQWSPYLKFGTSTSEMRLVSTAGVNSILEFAGNSGTTLGSTGVVAGSYAFLNYFDGANNQYFRIKSDAEIVANTLTIKDSSGNGFKFDTVAPTAGHVLYVDTLTGSVGNIKSGYIIKQWTGTTTGDPINTLYYTI